MLQLGDAMSLTLVRRGRGPSTRPVVNWSAWGSPACRLSLPILKENQEASIGEMRQRHDFKVHVSCAPMLSDVDPFTTGDFIFLLCLLDGGVQGKHQTFPRHLQYAEAGLAAWRPQKWTGFSPELQYLQLVIHQHAERVV